MPSTKFNGLAPIKNHKVQYTISAAAATGTFKLTAGGASMSVTPASTTIGDAVDSLVALFSDTNRPSEFSNVNAVKDSSTQFTLYMPPSPTSIYAQRPLGITKSTTGTGCTWASETALQLPNGPQWWSRDENWSAGAPDNSDDVLIEHWTGDICWGLDELATKTPAGIVIRGLRGALGLPLKHPQGLWTEWLPRYCKIKPTLLDIGVPSGIVQESGMLRFDLDSAVNAIVTVNNTGTATEAGREALILKGSDIERLKCFRGSIGVATDPGDTATIANLLVGSAAARIGAAGLFVRTSPGTTVADWVVSDGLWEVYAPPTNPGSFLGGEIVPNQFDLEINVATSVPARIVR